MSELIGGLIVYYLFSTFFCMGVDILLCNQHLISDKIFDRYALIILLVGWLVFPLLAMMLMLHSLDAEPEPMDYEEFRNYEENKSFLQRIIK